MTADRVARATSSDLAGDAADGAVRRHRFTDLALLIALVVVIIVISEMIGVRQLPITESVSLTFLPLVYAVLIAMVAGVPVWRRGLLRRVYSAANVGFASKYLIIVMLPLMAYYGSEVAPKIGEILGIGWVFLVQEVGNLGTVIIGLPIALLLGLRRRAIGSTLGLGREGELAYISERYGLDSEPGRGVLSIYLIGTLFGALFFSFFAPLLLQVGFDVRALAIASGMGSASMMTAASSTLAAHEQEQSGVVLSYAAASQLLTSFIGTYVMVFLAAPLQRTLYNLFMRGKDRLPAVGLRRLAVADSPSGGDGRLFTVRRYLVLTGVLLLSAALVLFTQQVKVLAGSDQSPVVPLTLAGLATLWLFSMIGIAVGDVMKHFKVPVLGTFPVLGWVSLVSLAGCLSWSGFVAAIGAVDFLSLTTPILAFAGISVVDRLADLTKTSWKVAITAIFVFIGIYVGGATIAQLGLLVTG